MNTRRPIPLHLKFVTAIIDRDLLSPMHRRGELDALSSVRISLVSSPFPEASTHTQLSGLPFCASMAALFFCPSRVRVEPTKKCRGTLRL